MRDNNGSFTKIYQHLFFSNQFKAVSQSARLLYIAMRLAIFKVSKKGEYINKSQFQIKFGYSDCHGAIPKSAYHRCLKELEDAGFIYRVTPGRMGNQKASYSFLDAWQDLNPHKKDPIDKQETSVCACGCGETIARYHKNGTEKKYVNYQHNLCHKVAQRQKS